MFIYYNLSAAHLDLSLILHVCYFKKKETKKQDQGLIPRNSDLAGLELGLICLKSSLGDNITQGLQTTTLDLFAIGQLQ